MILFQAADAPHHHRCAKAFQSFEWFTWSDHFLKELPALRREMPRAKIQFVYLKNVEEYNYTYSLDLTRLDPGFVRHFINYAYDLFHFSPGEAIRLFRDLIGGRMSSELFHFTFALFRALLVRLNDREMSALYTPLSKDNQNEFPLHCDLYIPKILWNVFEKVASDGSGYSTFLRLDTLFSKVIPQVPSIDTKTVRKLKLLVNAKEPVDHYQAFFDTLYEQPASSKALQSAQNDYKLRIRFHEGEGYMVHDRVWMHGREKQKP